MKLWKEETAGNRGEGGGGHDTFLFPHKNALFPDSRFSTHFFSMKMAELGENVILSCIIDFDDIQLCPRQFCLNLICAKL